MGGDGQSWLNDIAGDDDTPSLFEDQFRDMVEDEDLEALTADTIADRVDEISDPDLLAEAIETDDRDTCVNAYETRLDELDTDTTATDAGGDAAAASDAAADTSDSADVDDGPDTEAPGDHADADGGEKTVGVEGAMADLIGEDDADAGGGDDDSGADGGAGSASSDPQADSSSDGTQTTSDEKESADGPDTGEESVDVLKCDICDDAFAQEFAETDDGEEIALCRACHAEFESRSDGAGDDAAGQQDDATTAQPTTAAAEVDETTHTTSDGEESADGSTAATAAAADGGAAAAAAGPHSDDPAPAVDAVTSDIADLAPDAVACQEAAVDAGPRSVLVWGEEGTGKSHFAHSAPAPVMYIDTEGKARELADKFSDKRLFYFEVDDYAETIDAVNQALDALAAVQDEHGLRGTVVVDSMTTFWDWCKIDYVQTAFPSADHPEEVDFQSALQGEDDWKQIRSIRHNRKLREPLLRSPFNVVLVASAKEDYGATISQGVTPMKPDGERRNPYEVKDVVHLRTDDQGHTVGDLSKSARTRHAFEGLEWPEWDDVREAVDQIYAAEQADEPVDVTRWPFDVTEGQPMASDPSDGGEDDD